MDEKKRGPTEALAEYRKLLAEYTGDQQSEIARRLGEIARELGVDKESRERSPFYQLAKRLRESQERMAAPLTVLLLEQERARGGIPRWEGRITPSEGAGPESRPAVVPPIVPTTPTAIETPGLADHCRRSLPGLTWSEDFRHVTLNNESFTLTQFQAAAIEYLIDHSPNGPRDIPQEGILKAIDSASRSLVDIFKGSPAWKRLIVQRGVRGTYRLNV